MSAALRRPTTFASDVQMEAGLWFRYAGQKRDDVVSSSTFDAVLCGERTSTTRFAAWAGHAAWQRVAVGDLIRFFEDKERIKRSLVVRVLTIQSIDLASCDAQTLDAWSRAEGWRASKGRGLGQELGSALWLSHELIWPDRQAPVRTPQLSLF